MIAQADSIHIPLADKSVHCCVSSPPYWGLRKYAGEQGRIWGGDPECEHEWKEHIQPPKGGRNLPDNMPNTGGNKTQQLMDNPRFGVTTEFCVHCSAWYGSLGLEPIPEQHIENIVEICREVRRVLRDDGVFWLNYGDSYFGDSAVRTSGAEAFSKTWDKSQTASRGGNRRSAARRAGFQPGSLAMMPHRVAIALAEDGWIIRGDPVWSKPNPMPESIAGTRWIKHRIKVDRSKHASDHNIKGGTEAMLRDAGIHQGIDEDWVPEYVDCPGCEKCIPNDGLVLKRGSWRHTRAHEYVFMLTKKMGYWSNQEAVREIGTSGPSDVRKMEQQLERIGGKHKELDDPFAKASAVTNIGQKRSVGSPSGRNPRSVLDIPTQPYSGAHYATFPVNLIAPLIRATCPRWACPVCGQGWAPVVEMTAEYRAVLDSGKAWQTDSGKPDELTNRHNSDHPSQVPQKNKVLGYRPTCEHEHTQEEAVPGIVFDPFVGSGTTVAVAKSLLRRGVGIDISMEYLDQQAKVRAGLGTPSNALDDLPLFQSSY